MKKNRKLSSLFLFLVLSIFFLALGSYTAFAETEISLDDDSPTPVPTSQIEPLRMFPEPTAIPTEAPAISNAAQDTSSSSENIEITNESTDDEKPTPTPIVAQGFFKAKDAYEAGIHAYKAKDYDRAIKYLKLALKRHDEYTKKYIFAEANAMLGVIYQFHIIHPGAAYYYYKAALAIDPATRTARRHIREVAKYRHEKD